LTHAAAEAVAERDGVNVDGYRDYRGVPVVGAWKWLSDEGFGIATEVDVSESNQALYTINYAFWGIFALLAIASLAMLVSMRRADRFAMQARQAVLELKRLANTCSRKTGRGRHGVVYRARHAMLHRPTAVKFLDAAKTNEQAIARFEREVQLTSSSITPTPSRSTTTAGRQRVSFTTRWSTSRASICKTSSIDTARSRKGA